MSLLFRFLFLHAPASIATDLRQPLVVVTNWHWYGAGLFAILFAACAIATVAYVVLLRPARSRTPSIAWTIGLCATAIACAWITPAIFSSDVYAYAAYGEMVRLGSNPYAHAISPSGNSIFDAAIWQWGNSLPACVYGPAFVAIAAGIVCAAHGLPAVVTLDALRVVASLALLVCVPLAFLSYDGADAQRLTAAATIALNPAALWCAAEGHNDAIALAIVLGGCAIARRGRPALGAALAALSGTIKLPGIAAGIAIGYRDRRALVGAAIGALTTLVLSAPLLVGVATQLAPHGRFAPQASFESIVKPLLFLILHDDRTGSIVTVTIALAAAAACATAAIRSLCSGRLEGWSYAAIGGWLLIPNPYPWYAVWLLPIAALAPGCRASFVLVLFSLAALLRYVPDAVGAPTPAMQVILGIAATLPVVLLFAGHGGNSRAS